MGIFSKPLNNLRRMGQIRGGYNRYQNQRNMNDSFMDRSDLMAQDNQGAIPFIPPYLQDLYQQRRYQPINKGGYFVSRDPGMFVQQRQVPQEQIQSPWTYNYREGVGELDYANKTAAQNQPSLQYQMPAVNIDPYAAFDQYRTNRMTRPTGTFGGYETLNQPVIRTQ